jgi:hypothetical protein
VLVTHVSLPLLDCFLLSGKMEIYVSPRESVKLSPDSSLRSLNAQFCVDKMKKEGLP